MGARGRFGLLAVLALLCGLLLLPATGAHAAEGPKASASQAVYSLVNGCYGLRSKALGRQVATDKGPFRMQATQLGQYLLYGKAGNFLAGSGDSVVAAAQASPDADWKVSDASGAFRLTLPSGKVLTAAGGNLALASPGTGGDATLFTFERAGGCAVFPEVETSASGTPAKGKTSYSEQQGFIDAHMHMMAFEFLGGSAHCGRPWHPYGVAAALVDCPDHYPNGGGAALENVLFKQPVRTHDPVGWPTFKDWPHYKSLTHEGSYYKWLERAWMGGLRTYVNLLVDNSVLCEIYPLKRNSCNEMDGVRLQAKRIRELENYIDAQNGGPGKGWFRIVTSPFEARKVIAQGKLAVVLGIEVSKLFDCGIYNDAPECDRAMIDRQLDEVHKLGVRQMELINKFDNALGGVAGDSGDTGAVTNAGNKYETGRFFQLQHCDGPNHDHSPTAPTHNNDALVGNAFNAFLPPGGAPVYPPPPHCNTRGLSSLGEYLVKRMIEKDMIVDPDHLSVLARNQLLSIIEAHKYSGIVSSHSWSTPDAYPRILKSGGVVTPYAGGSSSFVKAWNELRPHKPKRFYWGFGYGADQNGFGSQGAPRNGPNPVQYPFKSFDGKVTFQRQVSGQRVFDINKDGVAHYGLYADWIEDLRKIAGPQIVKDMARGSEAYLQMWERAEGIQGPQCRSPHVHPTRRGISRVKMGANPSSLLRRAGQPVSRGPRAWRWCVAGPRNGKARISAVLTKKRKVGLIVTTARSRTALANGYSAKKIRRRSKAKKFGKGMLARPAGRGTRFVYGVRRGKVRFVVVASRSVSKSPKRLRAHLKLAGVR